MRITIYLHEIIKIKENQCRPTNILSQKSTGKYFSPRPYASWHCNSMLMTVNDDSDPDVIFLKLVNIKSVGSRCLQLCIVITRSF